MTLCDVFAKKNIVVDMQSSSKDEAFCELLEVAYKNMPQLNKDQALDILQHRESKMTTGVIHGVAVPHACLPCLKDDLVCGVIGISLKGIDYDAFDGAPVHILFLLLSSPEHIERHLQILKQLSLVLQAPGFCNELMQKTTAQDVFDTLATFENITK